jgi:hypothetical protein
MPRVRLVLGPLLRYAGTESATFWVETSMPCEVEILGRRHRTFTVEGHHYALLLVDDLEPGSVTPYEVRLDGELVWPPDDSRPPSVVRTRNHERRVRLVFGSCRIGGPQPDSLEPPWHDQLARAGVDALWSYSRSLQRGEEEWPDALLLLGDQVYTDEVSPATLAFIKGRRDTSDPPGEQIADFEEYTRLYRESWSDPDIRWLLSTVPSAMIFDDHDVIDDWNISWQWLKDARATPWWHARITGAFMAYWLYQHLGNLAPPELEEEAMYRTAIAAGGDVGPELEAFAEHADRESAASRWACSRDFGRSRVVVVDSRAARVLDDDHRDMVDREEWEWIVERSHEALDHLVIVSTLPVFMSPGVHYLEAWNEAVCAGAWGRPAAWVGERIRRALDLEHWPAFQRSFRTMVELLHELAEGPDSPGTISFIGGDVHTVYVAEVDIGERQESRVFQIVCSPFRNPLEPRERRAVKLFGTRGAGIVSRALARCAGVRRPDVSWKLVSPVTFDNSIAVLDLDERRAQLTIRRSAPENDEAWPLEQLYVRDLTPERTPS